VKSRVAPARIGNAPIVKLKRGAPPKTSIATAGMMAPPSPGAQRGWGVRATDVARHRRARRLTGDATRRVSTQTTASATTATPSHLR